jgi:hypothetical protein
MEESLVLGGRGGGFEPTVGGVLHDYGVVVFPKGWSALHRVVDDDPPLEVLGYNVALRRGRVQTDRCLHPVQAVRGKRHTEKEKNDGADRQHDGRDHSNQAYDVRHLPSSDVRKADGEDARMRMFSVPVAEHMGATPRVDAMSPRAMCCLGRG